MRRYLVWYGNREEILEFPYGTLDKEIQERIDRWLLDRCAEITLGYQEILPESSGAW